MNNYRSMALISFVFLGVISLAIWIFHPSQGFPEAREVMVIELEGPINPGTATFMTRGMKQAETQGFSLIIILKIQWRNKCYIQILNM